MNSEETIKNTILHEIAHAVVGSGHGHDIVWKRMTMLLGAKPERCNKNISDESHQHLAKKAPYNATCETCGFTAYAFKVLKSKRSCPKCCSRYNEKYVLKFIDRFGRPMPIPFTNYAPQKTASPIPPPPVSIFINQDASFEHVRIGTTFVAGRDTYEIIGFKHNRPKNPVLAKNLRTGGTAKCSMNFAAKAIEKTRNIKQTA